MQSLWLFHNLCRQISVYEYVKFSKDQDFFAFCLCICQISTEQSCVSRLWLHAGKRVETKRRIQCSESKRTNIQIFGGLSSGDNLSFYLFLFFKLICFYKQSMAHKKECFHQISAIWISSAVISKDLSYNLTFHVKVKSNHPILAVYHIKWSKCKE